MAHIQYRHVTDMASFLRDLHLLYISGIEHWQCSVGLLRYFFFFVCIFGFLATLLGTPVC